MIQAGLFWMLVLVLAGLFWLASGILGEIESLISPSEPVGCSRFVSRATLEGRISVNLAIVLAVIAASVGALAYEWRHAQTAKTQQSALFAHHQAKPGAKTAETHANKISTNRIEEE